MREHYERFKKATMHNGGAPLLQHTKQEVLFDPDNMAHMEAARILYFLEDPQPSKDQVKEHVEWCHRQEEHRNQRLALPFKFKLQQPFHDVRSMVVARIVKQAMEQHVKRMAQKPSLIRLSKAV